MRRMAKNESDIMRVHKDFKKYVCDIHEQTQIPITKITEEIAKNKPVAVKKLI